MDAGEVLRSGNPCLYPFISFMKGGPELFDEAELALTEAGISRNDKADLLTGMALLSGLVSKDLPRRLLSRRRDIMMESVAYEMIKKEGYEEGMQQGMQQGMLADAREMVLEALAERFKVVPRDLEDLISTLDSRRQLKDLLRHALRVQSIEEFRKILD